MLRQELQESVSRIIHAITETDLASHLEKQLTHDAKGGPNEDILGAMSRYMQLYDGFTSVERRLTEILGLDSLQDMTFWTAVLKSKPGSVDARVYEIYQNLNSVVKLLPRMIALLAREADELPPAAPKGEEETAPSVARLTVRVLEDTGTSSPARLVLVLESIQGLYDAAKQVLDEKADELSVISCDSGSDKSFDFLGGAKIVNCVKEIILSFWNNIVYFREDKSGRQLELIANSLPILEQIATLKDNGQLEPESAELLKRQVIDSVHKFARAGVTIPEIEQYTFFDPRQLMRPEPKLLVAPKTPSEEEAPEATGASAVDLDDPELSRFLANKAAEFLKQRGDTDSSDQSSDTGAEGSQSEDADDEE